MYIRDPHSPSGLLTLVLELLANVVDLHLAGKASQFSLTQNKQGWITVKDDGPGLPYDIVDNNSGVTLAENHFTIGHDTPTADDHSPHIHLSPLGIGLILINALSRKVEVKSVRNEVEYCQTIVNQEAGEVSKRRVSKPNGTSIRFIPDKTIFQKSTKLDWSTIRKELFDVAHLYPGLLIAYENERFISKNGLEDYVNLLTAHENCPTNNRAISLTSNSGECRINFACGGVRNKSEGIVIKSWVNGWFCNEGGTHIEGMETALKKANLDPAIAMISLVLDSPRFNSPTKSRLANEDIRHEVHKQLTEQFIHLGIS